MSEFERILEEMRSFNKKLDKTNQKIDSQNETFHRNFDNMKAIIDRNQYDANNQIQQISTKIGETDVSLKAYIEKNNQELDGIKKGFHEISKYVYQKDEQNPKYTYVDSGSKEPSSSKGNYKGKETAREEYQSKVYGKKLEFGQSHGGNFEKNKARGSNTNGDNNRDPNLNHHDYQEAFTRLRIDFPRFNEKKVQDWVYKTQQYFTCQRVPRAQWVGVSVIHFEEEAIRWYKWLRHRREDPIWEEFEEELMIRFGESSFINYDVSLKDLKQKGNVQDYQAEFEDLSCMVEWEEKSLMGGEISHSMKSMAMSVHGLEGTRRGTRWPGGLVASYFCL
ncbi:unnamed protein product [Victoria cruziana]